MLKLKYLINSIKIYEIKKVNTIENNKTLIIITIVGHQT